LILNRYIFVEMIPPFVMNLLFFVFVFLMRQILDITNLIVNYQVGASVFFLMLMFSLPYFFVYIIPMSVMMAVLLAFLRLSNDNEIIALKAGGISVYRFMLPVLAFGLVCALFTVFMAVYGMPWGRAAYKQLAFEVVRSNFNLGLKERRFNDSFDGLMFYVNKIDPASGALMDIFIDDHRKEGARIAVTAPMGFLFQGEDDATFNLRLRNGAINQVNLADRSAHLIRFDTYDLQLNLNNTVGSARAGKNEKEMSLSELTAYLQAAADHDKRYYSALIEFHRKFSIPFACIALAVLAVPLGVQTQTTRRSAGLGIGLAAFLVYYLLLSAGLVLGETGVVPPVIGLWAPNLIMGSAGVWLLVQTADDRSPDLLSLLGRIMNFFLKPKENSQKKS
jgi:lipopolysaccharide export system permease protein